MSTWDYVKCNKPRVKECGYRLPDGECAPKSAWPTMFECFEKESPKKKAAKVVQL